MHPRSLSIIAACILGGCSRSNERDFQSGSRLKVKYFDLDGTNVFEVFHDSERNEDCTFGYGNFIGALVTGPGGVAYCLPIGSPQAVAFADAACTDPLFYVPTGTSPTVVVTQPTDSCTKFPTVNALDPDTVDVSFELDLQGKCAAASSPENGALHRMGKPVSLDAFVRAEETTIGAGDRISRIDLVADDGARITIAGYDTKREESVLPFGSVSDPDATRWLPRGIAFGGGSAFFADVACEKPLATKDAYSAICPVTAVYDFIPQEGSCSGAYDYAIHEAGEPQTPSQSFVVDMNGSCVQGSNLVSDPDASIMVHEGALIAREEFVAVEVVDVGTKRVKQGYYGEPKQTPIIATGRLTDTKSGDRCGIGLADDGKHRCLPWSTSQPAFIDAACTVPVLLDENAGAMCPRPVPSRVSMQLSGDDRVSAFEVEPTLQNGIVYEGPPCVAMTAPLGWHALTKIDAATLPLATERTEP